MNNKTLVNLNDNLILKSENIEYGNEPLKNAIDKIIKGINIINGSSPVKAGYQVNNKDVYVMRFNISALPNATSVEYTLSNIPSNIEFVKIDGLYGDSFPINFIYPLDVNLSIGTYLYSKNKVQIITKSNRSTMSGYVDVYFIYN